MFCRSYALRSFYLSYLFYSYKNTIVLFRYSIQIITLLTVYYAYLQLTYNKVHKIWVQSELLSELTKTESAEHAVGRFILLPTITTRNLLERRTGKIFHLMLLFLLIDIEVLQGNCNSK